MKNYTQYRWFYTSQDTLVVGGKNASQNDQLMKEITSSGKDYLVMHTSSPGSPFSVLVKSKELVKKQELEECAIFTACFSKEWKQGKKKASVDVFTSAQLSKGKEMSVGTWRVSGKVERVSVPLELVLAIQKKKLRAVPSKSTKRPLARICPGSVDKTDMLVAIQFAIGVFPAEDVLAALPAGGVRLCK